MDDDLSLDLFGDAEPEPGASGPQPEPMPEPPGPKVWSVSQVNRAVRGLLDDSVDPLWIGGEVGGWTRSRAGHRYFTLKDERAQLRCVMFAREAERLPTDPDEGTKVRVFGALTLYEARGEYQLVVRQLEAEGAEGLWRLAFEKLRGKLEAEGLLDPLRKRPLPTHPSCVGVVTSLEGAALTDIVSVLARRAPWTRVVVRGTRVQGEGAAVEIASALRDLSDSGLADVIIVGRGGGSVEDLWAFNEEPVARAIVASSAPVVSAVGHEVDVTISDLVADLRAPTPSAAAESVVPDNSVVLASLRRVPAHLARALRGVSERRRASIEGRLATLTRSMERRFAPPRQALDRAMSRLERGTRGTAQERRRRLGTLAGRLEALSPLATLQRGYSVARTSEGQVLRTVADFESGTMFELRVTDGTVTAEALGPVEKEPGA
ncbi:MAG: exodeoxyribonuclease VII large subunit [Gemmatimonadota bacterium]|nr:exodeoxyribonuclease VII large subunit [Gemmatimonadota bacterium]